MDELIPEWKTKNSPLKTQATSDKFLYLTETKSFQLPTPPQMHNKGNYIISLSDFTKWLAQQAEELEVEIYPGFSASEVLYDENNKIEGIFGLGNDRTIQEYEKLSGIYLLNKNIKKSIKSILNDF